MNRMQWLALRLATMPLATGLISLVAWQTWPWNALLIAGYGALGIGVVAALFVPLLLLKAWPSAPSLRTSLLIGGLAVANIPVTFFCVDQGLKASSRYRVMIRNEAETPWRELQFISAGLSQELAALPPGQERTHDLWFRRDGRLELHFVDHDSPARVVVETYVRSGGGGQAVVIRSAAGEVRVEKD